MSSVPRSSNGRVRRSEAEWQGLMRRFEASGQSRSAFCASEGISKSTFELWHRKLRGRKSSSSRASKKNQEFIELSPVVDRTGGFLVEIELPDGTMARLRS